MRKIFGKYHPDLYPTDLPSLQDAFRLYPQAPLLHCNRRDPSNGFQQELQITVQLNQGIQTLKLCYLVLVLPLLLCSGPILQLLENF